MTRPDRGAVLLEIILAMTLLLLGGMSVASVLRAALQSEMALGQREATIREADRTLAALTLLGKGDLDRRIGRHPAGRFVGDIRRPEPALYRIALLDADTAAVELLVTVVHRPEQGRR